MPETAVRLMEPRGVTPKQSGFRLIVSNASKKPFDFGPESVVMKLPDGTSVAMLTYDDLMRKERRREGWQRFAAGLAAAGRNMQANNAGWETGTVNYSGQTYGTVGGTPYAANTMGTGTYSSYNSNAAMAAQATANQENQRDFEILRMNQAAAQANIAQVLKTTTVDPGQALGGVIEYMVPEAARSGKGPLAVTIEVRTGDDVHTFSGLLTKQ